MEHGSVRDRSVLRQIPAADTRSCFYTDPARMSPDDKWMVFMDGRVNDRMYFAGALPACLR